MLRVALSLLLPFLGPLGPVLAILGGVLGGFLKTRIGQIVAMVFVAAIGLYIWDIFDDRKVIAELEKKAEIHVTKSVAKADRISRGIDDPFKRLRRDFCDNC